MFGILEEFVPTKRKKEKTSDCRSPHCGLQVFLLDKEIKDGCFICKK